MLADLLQGVCLQMTTWSTWDNFGTICRQRQKYTIWISLPANENMDMTWTTWPTCKWKNKQKEHSGIQELPSKATICACVIGMVVNCNASNSPIPIENCRHFSRSHKDIFFMVHGSHCSSYLFKAQDRKSHNPSSKLFPLGMR